MSKIELLELLTKTAKDHRKGVNASIARNSHMNAWRCGELPQESIDAILVDFINTVGMGQCVNYALYAEDLRK